MKPWLKHLLWAIVLIVFLAGCGVGVYLVKNRKAQTTVFSNGNSQYVSIFNDSQDRQLPAAKKRAFKGAPLADRKSLQPVLESQRLVMVQSCPTYKIAPLTHSVPYLTPSAKMELDAIAADFSEKVKQEGLPECRLLVTSLLRTKEDIKDLKRINKNAVTNSAHLYGTTFDISWRSFPCTGKGRKADSDAYLRLLAEVLKDHRTSKKVYVKYETRETCFHITVRGKGTGGRSG